MCLWRMYSGTCSRSKAYCVSTDPPYASLKIPAQYQCSSFSLAFAGSSSVVEFHVQGSQRYELCVVGNVRLCEYELRVKKPGGSCKPKLGCRRQGLVLLKSQVQDVALLTTDARSLISGRTLQHLLSAPLLSCQQRDGLQELLTLDSAKDTEFLMHPLPPLIPIVAQGEIVSSKGRCY